MWASVDKYPCWAQDHFGPIRGSRCPKKDSCSGEGPFQKQLFLTSTISVLILKEIRRIPASTSQAFWPPQVAFKHSAVSCDKERKRVLVLFGLTFLECRPVCTPPFILGVRGTRGADFRNSGNDGGRYPSRGTAGGPHPAGELRIPVESASHRKSIESIQNHRSERQPSPSR
jgi:hypothetical protein